MDLTKAFGNRDRRRIRIGRVFPHLTQQPSRERGTPVGDEVIRARQKHSVERVVGGDGKTNERNREYRAVPEGQSGAQRRC